MTREEYEEYKNKKIIEVVALLAGKKCENCLFVTRRTKCYKNHIMNHDEINQCDDWEFEGNHRKN